MCPAGHRREAAPWTPGMPMSARQGWARRPPSACGRRRASGSPAATAAAAAAAMSAARRPAAWLLRRLPRPSHSPSSSLRRLLGGRHLGHTSSSSISRRRSVHSSNHRSGRYVPHSLSASGDRWQLVRLSFILAPKVGLTVKRGSASQAEQQQRQQQPAPGCNTCNQAVPPSQPARPPPSNGPPPQMPGQPPQPAPPPFSTAPVVTRSAAFRLQLQARSPLR